MAAGCPDGHCLSTRLSGSAYVVETKATRLAGAGASQITLPEMVTTPDLQQVGVGGSEPPVGIEPTTFSLRVRRSTD